MTHPEQDQPDDVPSISSDFLQGDIHRGLEAMRRRLLDLSGRNRLLNYRYAKKSSLRVVDEIPDAALRTPDVMAADIFAEHEAEDSFIRHSELDQ